MKQDRPFDRLHSRLIYEILTIMIILEKEELEKEGIEMAKILYEFIEANAHRFSSPILDAAIRLYDEIKKAEDVRS